MITILFTPSFDKQVRKLPPALLNAVSDALEAFKDRSNHQKLKVHKLHGRLKNCHAFSVDYKHRVVFRWITKHKVLLLDFGDHSVYE